MAAVGKFIHNAEYSAQTLSATTTFATARSKELDLSIDSPGVVGNGRSVCRLSGLYITVSTIAGGATALTMRLCRDAAGDVSVIGDTAATFSTGVTTATIGTVSFKIDVDYVYAASNKLFLFFKTDAGTCTVTNISLTWEE